MYFSYPSTATFHEKLAVSIDLASFGLHLTQGTVATRISFAILSMTLNFSLSWVSSTLPASFAPLILISKTRVTATTTKQPSYSDLKQIASHTTEFRQSIFPQSPSRYHQASHPVLTVSLSRLHILSGTFSNTARIDHTQNRGVFIKQSRVKTLKKPN